MISLVVSFLMPSFHFNEHVAPNSNCTAEVAFYRLKGVRGTVVGFSKDETSFKYEVFFGTANDIELSLQESCLEVVK